MNLLLSSFPRIRLLYLSTGGSVVGHVADGENKSKFGG